MKSTLLTLFIFLQFLNIAIAQSVLLVPSNYATIQNAIVASSNSDTILVSAGTYFETINYSGKNIVIKSISGPTNTIINGNNLNTVVIFGTNESNNAILDGFTIIDGTNTNSTFGGGITCINSSPTIKNCIIKNCSSPNGGGINCLGSCSPLIENNEICNNLSTNLIGGGGGIRFRNDSTFNSTFIVSNPTVVHNRIHNNTAVYNAGGIDFSGDLVAGIIKFNEIDTNTAKFGGGIHLDTYAYPTIDSNTVRVNNSTQNGAGIGVGDDCFPLVRYNLISNNSCPGKGGGIQCFNSRPLIAYNLIHDNHSSYGGGIYNWTTSKALIHNNTLVRNIADTLGAGIGIDPTADPAIVNCIIWMNKSPNNLQIEGIPNSLVYSNVENGITGIGNISTYPNFADTLSDDFTLNSNSICIDAGINNFTSPNGLTFSIPSSNYNGLMVDMGCFESSSTLGFLGTELNQTIKIYPNPFSDKINIANATGLEAYRLSNSFGQIIWNGKNIERQIFSYLEKGIYFLQISSQNGQQTLQLIKQ